MGMFGRFGAYPVLKQGTTISTDILKLQQLLNKQGYLAPQYVNGFFGAETTLAVQTFQQAFRLNDPAGFGVAGEMTWTVLLNPDAALGFQIAAQRGTRGAVVGGSPVSASGAVMDPEGTARWKMDQDRLAREAAARTEASSASATLVPGPVVSKSSRAIWYVAGLGAVFTLWRVLR